jgi:hypothetical protein
MVGLIGCGCCGGGGGSCSCESKLPDNLRFHYVGATSDAFYGMASAKAALCTGNCTSRLWTDLDYAIDEDVETDSARWARRLVADVPEKTGAKLWVGCTTEISNGLGGWIPSYFGPQSITEWDGIGSDYVTREDSKERVYDQDEIAHVYSYINSVGDAWQPYFYTWLPYTAGSFTPSLTLRGGTLHSAVVAQSQNSKLNFLHKHQQQFGTCPPNIWKHSGLFPKVTMSYGQDSIASFLCVRNGQELYQQSDLVSGIVNGFQPFSFIPLTGSVSRPPTAGTRISTVFRTSFATSIDDNSSPGNCRLSVGFEHREYGVWSNPIWGLDTYQPIVATGIGFFDFPRGIGGTWTILVNVINQVSLTTTTVPCTISLEFLAV